MTETAPQMSPRAQAREILSHEPVSLVPVTERNFPKFQATLTDVNNRSKADGMLPMTGDPQESNEAWAAATRGLWLIGAKDSDFSLPENVAGFVNAYAPEHINEVNDWLVKKGMRGYDAGAVVELSSFVKDEAKADVGISGEKQALGKVFMDDAFKDVRAVTMWVTHLAENTLDPKDVSDMKKLGGRPLGSLKYDASESVDSTCFLITRRGFLDALMGPKKA